MIEIINIYKKNRLAIESFLLTSIQSRNMQSCAIDPGTLQNCFGIMPALAMAYTVNEELIQTSGHFYRNKYDESTKGTDKSYFFQRVRFEDNGIFISNSYINSHTGKLSVTIARKVAGGYLVYDFDLVRLLEQLNLIQSNHILDLANKWIYGAIGVGLAVFALFLVGYGGYIFLESVVKSEAADLQSTFKAIISFTLGLAIYDLASTVLQQGVFYKNYYDEEGREAKVLVKFLISILIALSIEALMVVFKITLADYRDMVHALYLIIGVSSLILALGGFIYFNRRKGGSE